jgi:hypothetical protein
MFPMQHDLSLFSFPGLTPTATALAILDSTLLAVTSEGGLAGCQFGGRFGVQF